MVYQIQTKKGRNLRCISLQYNKEDTFEKKKDYTDPMKRWTPWRGRDYTLYRRCEDEAS